jgi:hypothetical protein
MFMRPTIFLNPTRAGIVRWFEICREPARWCVVQLVADRLQLGAGRILDPSGGFCFLRTYETRELPRECSKDLHEIR